MEPPTQRLAVFLNFAAQFLGEYPRGRGDADAFIFQPHAGAQSIEL
jgi:hypothetical protein